MSKRELTYKVIDSPQIRRNVGEVKLAAHDPRAVVVEDALNSEKGVVVSSDRTDYSAYSERCWLTTVTGGELTKEELIGMNLREFSENIGFRWAMNRQNKNSESRIMSSNEVNNEEGSGVQNEDVTLPEDVNKNEEGARSSRIKWRYRDRRSGYWLIW
jgi:hypothetical protein